MDFMKFKAAVAARFEKMKKFPLFRTTAPKDLLWSTYLESFPEGTNPIYRERREYDCNCCKQFVRAIGNVVAIIDGHVVSIWDITIDEPSYDTVAKAMAAVVKQHPIDNVFRHTERTAGTEKNFEALTEPGAVRTWNHFFVNIPETYVVKKATLGTVLGEYRSTFDVMRRGLIEITDEAVSTVQELIEQNSLYRGAEHKPAVDAFARLKATYKKNPTDEFIWASLNNSARIRNTAIGTLLVDLSEGRELDAAVASFESKVAPANYKRPTALVTKAMIDNAKKTIEELGLTSALERRYATIDDITINNVLFADRSVKAQLGGDVFDGLATKSEKPANFDKVEEVTIEQFLAHILPKADTVEVMMDNAHTGNLVSLISPVDSTARSLFKWPNNFSWSYNGEFADSIKERVKAAGGNVTGELCCRLAWDYTDDLDFHMYEPNGGRIYFGNRRQLSRNGGMLDVDANGADGIRANPVENIFYERISTMRPGAYVLKVNNYRRRSSGVGFEVEIDIKGEVHRFAYDRALASDSTVVVATLHVAKDGTVTVEAALPSTTSQKEVWNVKTNAFQKVSAVMLSPNFWDDRQIGNKHFFFMLDGCLNDGKARGFFNEFLIDDLTPHRKVIEMVGSKMKTDLSDRQLSGLGFSSTQRNSLLCRVKGSFSRVIKIIF